MVKLSILIPTLPEEYSARFLSRLNSILDPQIEKYSGQVEKVIHDAPRAMPTGSKRNQLIENSTGEYFSFVDCDDVVPDYYVDELMTAIQQGPDVITFKGRMTTDGKYPAWFTIKLGSEYKEHKGHYYRYPNHLCCFKRSVVGHVKFPSKWIQEDFDYATQIHRMGLLKTEIHIERDMYLYEFVTNKPRR